MNNQEAIKALRDNYPASRHLTLCEAVDTAISALGVIKGSTSDGSHSIDELYYHRMILFSVICNQNKDKSYKSKLHHDGTMYANYFVAGVTTAQGDYNYHYHLDNWKYFNCKELPNAPEWDGHKPEDITRLLDL